MTDDVPFYAPNRPPRPPRQAKPGEPIWSLTMPTGIRVECELRDHGDYGVEVQIFHTVNERDFFYGRRWPSRAVALEEADERKAEYVRDGGVLT